MKQEKVKKLEKAIKHLLYQIRNNPQLRSEIGFGTESFELLTEAGAVVFDAPVEKIQEFCLSGEN